MHIGYADGSGEVICQGRHVLETDLFEGVNVQSVARGFVCVRVCVCVCVRACWESSVVCSLPLQLLGSFTPLLIREKASATKFATKRVG